MNTLLCKSRYLSRGWVKALKKYENLHIMFKPSFDPFNQEVNGLVYNLVNPNPYKKKYYLKNLQDKFSKGKIIDSKVDKAFFDNEYIQKLQDTFNKIINFYKLYK